MRRGVPAGWIRSHYEQLLYDGASTEYRQAGGRCFAYIEAEACDDANNPDGLQYRPSIIAPDGTFAVYPEIHDDREAALDRLFEMMREYPPSRTSSSGPGSGSESETDR